MECKCEYFLAAALGLDIGKCSICDYVAPLVGQNRVCSSCAQGGLAIRKYAENHLACPGSGSVKHRVCGCVLERMAKLEKVVEAARKLNIEIEEGMGLSIEACDGVSEALKALED